MPRRREVPKREILPDPKYGNVELSKFMNVIMEGGKKAVAERIIYGALEQIEQKSGKDPLELFNVAINNVKPQMRLNTPYAVPRKSSGAVAATMVANKPCVMPMCTPHRVTPSSRCQAEVLIAKTTSPAISTTKPHASKVT